MSGLHHKKHPRKKRVSWKRFTFVVSQHAQHFLSFDANAQTFALWYCTIRLIRSIRSAYPIRSMNYVIWLFACAQIKKLTAHIKKRSPEVIPAFAAKAKVSVGNTFQRQFRKIPYVKVRVVATSSSSKFEQSRISRVLVHFNETSTILWSYLYRCVISFVLALRS